MEITSAEITVEINPLNGTWEEAEEIMKKICETHNDINCTLRIKVIGISS